METATKTARRRSGGPRTEWGKRQSARNSIKHGIFAECVLADERGEEYDEMVTKWCEYYQPAGAPEEVLVDRLVMLYWRYRRLVSAESAEIERARVPKSAGERRMWDSYGIASKKPLIEKNGLLLYATSENEFAAAEYFLTQVHDAIKQSGPDYQRDRDALKRVYGYGDDGEPEGLIADVYRKLEGRMDDDMFKEALLKAAADEIKAAHASWEEKREESERWEELGRTASLVPRGEAAKNLGAYETRLDRAIHRTIMDLERMQKARRATEAAGGGPKAGPKKPPQRHEVPESKVTKTPTAPAWSPCDSPACYNEKFSLCGQATQYASGFSISSPSGGTVW